jgi:hypothetical protein
MNLLRNREDVLSLGLSPDVHRTAEKLQTTELSDQLLLDLLMDSPVLLYLTLAYSSAVSPRFLRLPDNVATIYRIIGRQRTGEYLQAMLHILPVTVVDPKVLALNKTIRSISDSLVKNCLSASVAGAALLLRLLELVPLAASTAGKPLPHWREWGSILNPLTGIGYGIKPQIQQTFEYLAEPGEAKDPMIADLAACLHLTLSICFSSTDPSSVSVQNMQCDSSVWTTLGIQPYELSFLQGDLVHV